MITLFRHITFILFISFLPIRIYGTNCSIPAQLQLPVNEPTFPFPEIPIALQNPDARKEFLLRHYWDCFDFSDNKLVENKAISEQGLVNFLALLLDEKNSEELKKEAFHLYCLKMSRFIHARKYFMEMTSKYLYDVNSPMHNEPLYTLYLRELLTCETLNMAERRRNEFILKLVERNNPKQLATNFRFITSDNQPRTLKSMGIKGNYVLIIFYDPECEQCSEVLSTMTQDGWLSSQVESKHMSVLAIYTEGDKDIWQAGFSAIPPAWTNGFDYGKIKEQALYDLKAMPSLYLLDNQKRVILKDASYEEIKAYLIQSFTK